MRPLNRGCQKTLAVQDAERWDDAVLQDTLKGPGEAKKLKTATTYSVMITTFFYLTVGLIGYAA